MGRIRILEDHLVNQIAAGEVVERPASVVKELVENALDAQADRVVVTLRAGGRELIRIEDNGVGMDPDDVLMCIERHGTSKIRREEDLGRVHTLGFRGEALPSIASVARVEIVSRPADADVGFKVVVEGGRMRKPEPTGAAPGTRITVRNLFFNIPVRRGFLRTVPTELNHCVEAVRREALVRPHVDFKVEHEGRTLLRGPQADGRARRAMDLLPSHGDSLVPVSFSAGELEVEALLSPVGVHKPGAAGAMYLYVNGRFVRDPLLRRAVNEAYRHLIPKGRYPVVVLEVRLPVEDVDVNIHPAKTEVRFRYGQQLFEVLSEGLRAGLHEKGVQTQRPFQRSPEAPGQSALPFSVAEPQAAPTSPAPRPPVPEPPQIPKASQQSPVAPSADRPQAPPPLRPYVDPFAPVPSRTSQAPSGITSVGQGLQLVGQAGRTLVCQRASDLLLFDIPRVQSALLESELRSGRASARPLLTPELVDLGPEQAKALRGRLDALPGTVRIEDYGEGTFAVMAVHPSLGRGDLPHLVRALAAGEDMVSVIVRSAQEAEISKLSPFELRALVKELTRLGPDALAWVLSGDELARKLR